MWGVVRPSLSYKGRVIRGGLGGKVWGVPPTSLPSGRGIFLPWSGLVPSGHQLRVRHEDTGSCGWPVRVPPPGVLYSRQWGRLTPPPWVVCYLGGDLLSTRVIQAPSL